MFWNNKAKEDSLTQQVSFLERENQALRGEQAALRAENLHLRTLISDLQADFRTLSLEASKERQDILDRFTAIISPTAYSNLRTGKPLVRSSVPARINFPGDSSDFRPPYTSEVSIGVQANKEKVPEPSA
jgi:hypothetical protein